MKLDFPRQIALTALYEMEQDKAYSNLVLEKIFHKSRDQLSNIDIGFISELVYGVTTWRLTLDNIIQKYANIKIKKMSIYVRNLLRMGAYQIVFLDKVPKSAAVNESVNLAKKYAPKSTGLINAILRKIEKQDLQELDKIENPIERISKTTSMPEWIIKKLAEEFSYTEVKRICKNSNQKAKVSIRVNNLKITKQELKQKLQELGIDYEDGMLEDFLILKNIKDIIHLELYKEGYFSLQDEAAGLVPLCLKPQERDNVLDACSAPGGKTTYLAELMNDKGNIQAWDLYESRLDQVKENSKRLGITIIQTQTKDSAKYDPSQIEKYDKILLDVPCLGLGVLRRKPDIKWQRKEQDIKEIAEIQLEILKQCAQYLKIGGSLIYSTCSILKEENEDIITKFLKQDTRFEIEKLEMKEIKSYKKFLTSKGMLKLYPEPGNDGFFLCSLKRNQ